jgi:glycosyltransferase involved in cell wall biosynthesis
MLATVRTKVEDDDMDQGCCYPPYVLISPARNEEAFIAKTIESVVHQTVRPLKWVIVDDGSTDRTPEIVKSYLTQHPWIEMVRMPQRENRSFASKVYAFNAGLDKVKSLDYEIIGNLDADLSFEPDYVEFILSKFMEDNVLGVAGTIFKEEGYSSDRQSFEGHKHVAGGCQLFRRQCFEEIGGFKANEGGGVDWIAVTTARFMGWKTRSFRQKSFFHHRHLGTAERGTLTAMFAYGQKDYYFGGHPIWELFRVFYRMAKRPYFVAGLGLGLGYTWAMMLMKKRPVSRELMKFHRKEQMQKLGTILKSFLTFKPVDSFTVLPE